MKVGISAAVLLASCLLASAEDKPKADAKPAAEAPKPVKEKTFNPEFDDAPLSDVLQWMSKEMGWEYDLTKDASKLSKKGAVKVRVVGKDLTAKEILDMALAQVELTWMEAEKGPSTIQIVTVAEDATDRVLQLHDVRDLLNPITDFVGPESGGFKTTKRKTMGPKGEQQNEYPEGHVIHEPEEGEKPKDPKPMEDPRALPDLIRNGTGADAWIDGTHIDLVNGILYIKAPRRLQRKVAGFLNQLRQYK